MKNPSPSQVTFYGFTDPETADKVIASGYAGAGVWTPGATVALFDRPPSGVGRGAVLRVSLPPDAAREVLKHPSYSIDEDERHFAAPLELLRDAYIVRME